MAPTRRQLLATVTALSLPIAGCTGEQTGGGAQETTTTEAMVETTTEETTAAETTEETTEAETTAETETTTEEGETTTEGEAMTEEALLSTRSTEEYGDIVVGPEEMTLYMFEQDTQGSGESSCTNGCAEAWPPLTVESDEEASKSEDITAEVGTLERQDGSIQVSVAGWPVYYFQNDESPGDVNGQGFDGVWWVLGPDGSPVESAGTTTTTTEESGGGGGGGDDDDDDDDDGGGGVY